ncbi:C-type lectin [Plakobranchus ocellatus]|uniref:C-type lectin n=1 Tax=Plakobranchus ocellatus TaxID=259542 RepID=A0AAV4BBF3_9GAST|nr:C-type lectin [Plakobranchus ocellatus]
MSVSAILLLLGALMIASVEGYVSYHQEFRFPKRYYVSMEYEPFGLAKMHGRCKTLGGHLVTLDDKDEFDYVKFVVGAVRGRGPFFTGITDTKQEGTWLNYHDSKPAKYLKWRWFQPDNYWGEDCVEIGYYGLNDKGCEKKGRYICEVHYSNVKD